MKNILVLLLFSFSAFSQERIVNLFEIVDDSNKSTLEDFFLTDRSNIKTYDFLSIDQTKSNILKNQKGKYIISIPSNNFGSIEIELEPITIVSTDFKITNSKGNSILVDLPMTYRGRVLGSKKSFVAIAVTNQGLEGTIIGDNFNLSIGSLRDKKRSSHILYNNKEVSFDSPIETAQPIIFEEPIRKINGEIVKPKSSLLKNTISTNSLACTAVRVYIETDYQTYLDHGGNSLNVANWVLSIFTNVGQLYQNESINLIISEIKIWDTIDPYNTAMDVYTALNLFDNIIFENANIAHLMSTRGLGGGLANYTFGTPVYGAMTERAIFSNCSKSQAFAVSSDLVTTVTNLPNYSWNTYEIAHEIGHNFGLPHTHSCNWPGGAIDNCSTVSVSCTPPSSLPAAGTIMSYCHQNVGIDFSLGFGIMPGDKMRSEVLAATCLGSITTSPTVMEEISVCIGGSATLIASGCSGTVNWYDQEYNGNLLTTGSSFITPASTKTVNYYVECNENSCTSLRSTVRVLATPEKTVICNESPIVANYGDNTLNLGLNYGRGKILTSHKDTLKAIGSNIIYGFADGTQTFCTQSDGWLVPTATLHFRVNQSGYYTIFNNTGYSLHNATSTDCNSFISSNIVFNGINNFGIGGSNPILFESCTDYYLVSYDFYSYNDIIIEFNGVGNVLSIKDNSPSLGFNYSYVAINNSTNKIEYVSANADFRFLSGGDFNVYGLSFNSSSLPGELVGKTLNQALTINPCLGISSNFKPLKIYCPSGISHLNTTQNPGIYRAIESIESKTNLQNRSEYIAGKSILLSPGFEIGIQENFKAEIGGCSNPTP